MYKPLKTRRKYRAALTLVAAAIGLSACGGSSGGSSPPPPPPPPPAPTVTTYDVTLAAEQVVAGSAEAGSGDAALVHNETDGEISVTVELVGITADAVSVKSGHAGETGPIVYSLAAGTTAGTWELPATAATADAVAALERGALYVDVTTAAAPDGALRGQVLPAGIGIERIELVPELVTAGSASGGSGIAWATIDSARSEITVHANTEDLTDISSFEIRNAVAGTDGPVLASLAPDPADPAHWSLDTTAFTTAMETAAAAGALYVAVATLDEPDGALRGQFIPPGTELVMTALTGNAVVMSAFANPGPATLGRAATTITGDAFTTHVNLDGIPDADGVELRRAPAGQNGPVVMTFEQNLNEPSRFSLVDVAVDAGLAASFDNRTLYISVTTPQAPDGVARGQIETAGSMLPPDDSAFVVTAIDPPNAAAVTSLPDAVVATLNREPLAASVTPQAVRVEASGGDGSFGDGNETAITPASVSSGPASVTISLAGVSAADDVYRVMLFGGGANGIVDLAGIPLDGDADGSPGGDFESAFELEQVTVQATLTEIQQTIFTPSCAVSGCHTGANPPDGLNLSDGVAWSNIVNVASVQMPALLRIEPGDPDNSYLVRKVQGDGIVANRMPLGAAPLDQEQIDLIRQWVTDGAADN